MNRVDEIWFPYLDSIGQFQSYHVSRYCLERSHERLQIDPARKVLITYSHDCTPFFTIILREFQAISNSANVPRIRVQKINRPILRFLTIVPKRPNQFELDGPLFRYQEIRRASSNGRAAVSRESI